MNPPFKQLTHSWAWGGSTGCGVRVAVLDSGIDGDHPAIDNRLAGCIAPREGPEGIVFDYGPHGDASGHGNACAGLIRALAADCALYSVKVLGAAQAGRGAVFTAGLRWAIEHDMQVCNLSLGTTRKEFYGLLHELVDDAYFKNVIIVAAVNNLAITSFPSSYASVISVAACGGNDPYQLYYNPGVTPEFHALGVDVRVAWKDGGYRIQTGNSFAAAHVTGLVARLLAKHPGMTLPQVKTVLQALADRSGDGAKTIAPIHPRRRSRPIVISTQRRIHDRTRHWEK